MKLIVSSYKKQQSLAYLNLDLHHKTYQTLDTKDLNAPSFIIKNNHFLFTYSKDPLKLIAYQINSHTLTKVDEILIPGNTLTHLCFAKKKKCLFAASYLDGAYLKVDFKKNHFTNLKYVIMPNRPSKCHCVFLNKDETILNVIDIEQDTIYQFDLDLNLQNEIKLPTKCGPRHGIYIGDNIYVVTEYSNEVLVINKDGLLIDKISTLNGYQGESYGATILKIKHNIYASNRGLETIACYNIENNHLVFKQMLDVHGQHSRHMIKTPNNKYLISFNKNSNNITIIDVATKNLIMKIPFESVSCGVFIA